MTNRLAVGALVGALMVVASGCTSDECIDQFDCNNNKGSAGTGKAWSCVENKCVARDVNTEPTPDAGTQPDDAGTQTDAGTQPDDAGTQTPGDMTIDEGGDCTTTASCMAGLYCGTDKKCAPLHIAVTAGPTTNETPSYAVVVPYNKAVAPTQLSENTAATSKFPRWSPGGSAVAFVEVTTDATTNTQSVSLVSRNIPLVAGQVTPLTTGAADAANTTDFRYMEWEPSDTIAWSQTSATATTGIWTYKAPGPAMSATPTGVFPSWAADGTSFVYSLSNQGIQNKPANAASSPVAGAPVTAEQPLHNKANGVLLFLDAKGNVETVSNTNTPLTGLYTLNPAATSPTPNEIAAPRQESAGLDGEVRSYIANHTWAPGGTHVAYVRVFYFKPTLGSSVLCSGGANCGGRQGNVVYVRRIDVASGTPSGDEIEFTTEGTLPSFSPDGQFIAYLSGAQLKVQKIDPAATTAATLKVGAVISHTWSGNVQKVLSNRSDDHRPRWQPR